MKIGYCFIAATGAIFLLILDGKSSSDPGIRTLRGTFLDAIREVARFNTDAGITVVEGTEKNYNYFP